MNKEEIKDWIDYIELVDNELCNSKTKDIRETYVYKLQQENHKLKDNWNKLKEFIKSQNDGGIFGDLMVTRDVLNKMQELEKGEENE